MKTIFSLAAMLVLALMALSYAVGGEAAVTCTLTDATYEWTVERAGSSTFGNGGFTSPDTMTGTDSVCLLKYYHFATGWDYIWMYQPFGGNAGASDYSAVRCDFYDANKTYLYSTTIDSLTGSVAVVNGGAIMLPVNRTAYAYYMSIELVGTASFSTRKQITTGSKQTILRRRALVTPKAWQ